jgi:hypothetical protein
MRGVRSAVTGRHSTALEDGSAESALTTHLVEDALRASSNGGGEPFRHFAPNLSAIAWGILSARARPVVSSNRSRVRAMLIAAAAARVIAAGSTLAAHSTTLALHTQHTAHTAVLRQRVLCAVVLAAVAAVCCGSRAEAAAAAAAPARAGAAAGPAAV